MGSKRIARAASVGCVVTGRIRDHRVRNHHEGVDLRELGTGHPQ